MIILRFLPYFAFFFFASFYSSLFCPIFCQVFSNKHTQYSKKFLYQVQDFKNPYIIFKKPLNKAGKKSSLMLDDIDTRFRGTSVVGYKLRVQLVMACFVCILRIFEEY